MKKIYSLLPLLIVPTSFLIADFNMDGHPDLYSGYEGYKSCQGCHGDDFDEHANAVKNSIHWTWEMTDSHTGDSVGKINVINNYCVAVPSNEPRCTSCHVGIGWSDSDFDLTSTDHIDCLVCHDGSGTYSKIATGAGEPVANLDYQLIMRSFQSPDRNNCGSCHFNGGGGDGVKHGTMDTSLAMDSETLNPSVDVHMGGSLNMTCIDCHSQGASNPHEFIGSRYSKSDNDASLCISCHTDGGSTAPQPQHAGLASRHFDVLACQACHVPALARGGQSTKIYWDWETAGNRVDNNDGTFGDRVIKDARGDITYHSKKGTFVWGQNIVPKYTWSNGTVDHITPTDIIDPSGRTKMNTLLSDQTTKSKIFPVKVFVGRQPYDKGTNTIAVPHLYPTAAEKAGSVEKRAFWMVYDWEKAVTAGQESIGLTYSGAGVGFAETDMTWIANHMVAPAAEAVQCWECHQSKDRLDFDALGLTGGNWPQTDQRNVQYGGYRIELVDDYEYIGTLHLGSLEVSNAPWVYSYDLGQYLFLPEDAMTMFGAWTYLLK